jgi:octaprenyl-diphosphate synthase
MRQAANSEAQLIKDAIEQGNVAMIEQVTAIINQTGAIDYTIKIAEQQAKLAQMALDPLPDSTFKDAMYALANLAVNRRS